MLNIRLKSCHKETIINNKGRLVHRDIVVGNRRRGLYNENYKNLVWFNLNLQHSKLVKRVSIDLYLLNLLDCAFLDVYLMVRGDEILEDKVVVKRVTKYDVGKVISIDISSIANKFNYVIGKRTCIEIFTKAPSGYAFFRWSNKLNTPTLQVLYDKLDAKEILYNIPKTEEKLEKVEEVEVNNIVEGDKYTVDEDVNTKSDKEIITEEVKNRPIGKKKSEGMLNEDDYNKYPIGKIKNSTARQEDLVESTTGGLKISEAVKPEVINERPVGKLKEVITIGKRKTIYECGEELKKVLYKLIGQDVELEVHDMFIKYLSGKIHSINGDNLILKDGQYLSLINIPSIIILLNKNDVEIHSKESTIESDEEVYGMKEVFLLFRKGGKSFKLNTNYFGNKDFEIVDATNSLVKLKELGVISEAVYILNNYYINVIDKIALDDNILSKF